MPPKKPEDLKSLAGAHLSDHLTSRHTERTRALFNDSEELVKLAKKWKNVAPDKAQGHLFEQMEVLNFNYDALKKDSDLFARTTASMGLPTDPVDIIITRGKKTVREVQAKSCNSAARSVFALSQEKYDEMARLAPADQHEMIEKLLDQRIKAGTLKASDYEKTREHLQKSLSHENVSSSGTNYEQSLAATDTKIAEKISDQVKLKSALTDMHKSGKQAGQLGAIISGSSSVITSSYDFYKGTKSIGETLSSITIDAAKGYATGYTVTAMSKGITHGTSHFLGQSASKALTRSNAPIAIAAGVVAASKSIASFIKGDIDEEKLLDEISHTAITSTASFYYGALGQVAIPIPVVGAMVGASIGYFVGNMLHQSSLIALGESKIVKEAKHRRLAIEEMCLSLIPQIRNQRIAFEAQLTKHFNERDTEFRIAFMQLDSSLEDWSPNGFVSGLEKINLQFGKTLQFKTFEEFDDFMQTNEAFEF